MAQIITVPSAVTLSSVAAFAQDIWHHLSRQDGITLNLENLVEADLSFIQVVCAARDHARDQDTTIRLAQPASAAVKALLGRAGFLDAPSRDDLEFWFDGEVAQ